MGDVKKETVSTERLEDRHHDPKRNVILNTASHDLENIIQGHDPEVHHLGNRVWDRLDKLAVEIEEHALSRTQEPAEWQVEKAADALERQFVAGGPDVPWEKAARAALRAASIPAPERSKEETGVRVKPLEWENNGGTWVADTPVGAWTVEHSLAGAGFAVFWGEALNLGVYATEARSKAAAQADYEQRILSALETPPLHKEGEVEYITVDHKGCIFHSKDMDGIARIAKANLEAAVDAAAPVPVPVTITPEPKRVPHEVAIAGFYEAQKAEVKAKPLYDQCCSIYQAMRAAALSAKPQIGSDKA